MITYRTKLCGSIAGRASMLGPLMHNAAYEYLGLDFIYMSYGISDLEGAIAGMRALGIRGLAVSMPFKQVVMKHLDEIDPIASRIGAVNTIVNENGKLTGYNSDWIGAVRALEEKVSLLGKKVILVGAGGAGRAIAYGLSDRRAIVTICNRTVDKAKQVSVEFGLKIGGDIRSLSKADDYDIIINATPVGSPPNLNESIIPQGILRANKIVMDLISYPLKTKLIQEAEEAKCVGIPGYRMSIHQALFQFEMFTGQKAPFDIMEKALREGLESRTD